MPPRGTLAGLTLTLLRVGAEGVGVLLTSGVLRGGRWVPVIVGVRCAGGSSRRGGGGIGGTCRGDGRSEDG